MVFRCRPWFKLVLILNYEAISVVLKVLTEARNRQPETFKPNQTSVYRETIAAVVFFLAYFSFFLFEKIKKNKSRF